MKCSSAWRKSCCHHSRPGLAVKIKLVDVIESLLVLINSTKYEHRSLRRTCRVSITALNCAFHPCKLEPDVLLKVVGVEMVKGFGAIPTSEDVHERLVDNCSVPKPDIGLADESHVVKHGSGALLLVREHDACYLIAFGVSVMKYLLPDVVCHLILMNVLENLDFVATTVHVEPVLVPHKSVISPCLRHLSYSAWNFIVSAATSIRSSCLSWCSTP